MEGEDEDNESSPEQNDPFTLTPEQVAYLQQLQQEQNLSED